MRFVLLIALYVGCVLGVSLGISQQDPPEDRVRQASSLVESSLLDILTRLDALEAESQLQAEQIQELRDLLSRNDEPNPPLGLEPLYASVDFWGEVPVSVQLCDVPSMPMLHGAVCREEPEGSRYVTASQEKISAALDRMGLPEDYSGPLVIDSEPYTEPWDLARAEEHYRTLAERVRSARPGVKLAFFGIPTIRLSTFQDIPPLEAFGTIFEHVDFVAPQLYHGATTKWTLADESRTTRRAELALQIGKPVVGMIHGWPGGSAGDTSSAVWLEPELVAKRALLLKSLGVEHLGYWGAKIQPADHDRVWPQHLTAVQEALFPDPRLTPPTLPDEEVIRIVGEIITEPIKPTAGKRYLVLEQCMWRDFCPWDPRDFERVITIGCTASDAIGSKLFMRGEHYDAVVTDFRGDAFREPVVLVNCEVRNQVPLPEDAPNYMHSDCIQFYSAAGEDIDGVFIWGFKAVENINGQAFFSRIGGVMRNLTLKHSQFDVRSLPARQQVRNPVLGGVIENNKFLGAPVDFKTEFAGSENVRVRFNTFQWVGDSADLEQMPTVVWDSNDFLNVWPAYSNRAGTPVGTLVGTNALQVGTN